MDCRYSVIVCICKVFGGKRGLQGNFQAHPSCDILDGLDLTSPGLDCEPVSLGSAVVSIVDVTRAGHLSDLLVSY